MKKDIDAVREAGGRLAHESARFAAMGWMRATSGNLSEVISREPLRLAVTPSGFDKGDLTRDDVVVVDAVGARVPVRGLAPLKPSDEAALHARIAARSGAGAVVHVHALAGVLAARRWPDGIHIRGLEMLKALGRRDDEDVVVPVIRNSQDMAELGDSFDATFDAAVPALAVANHGLYVWGSTLTQARHRTEAIEWLLNAVLAGAAGDDRAIDRLEADYAAY